MSDIRARLSFKYSRVENGITEISIENLKSADPSLKFSITDFIKIFTVTDTLPDLSTRLNLWTNFSSKDFKAGDFKHVQDIRDCTVLCRRDIFTDFYGHFFFIRNIDKGTQAKIRLRSKFNRNNLKIRMATSLQILDKHLKLVPDEIVNKTYFANSYLTGVDFNKFNAPMRRAVEDQMPSVSRNQNIFYPYEIVEWLLSRDSFLTDCVNYEKRKNINDPKTIRNNVYNVAKTSDSGLFEHESVDESFELDNDIKYLLAAEDLNDLEE